MVRPPPQNLSNRSMWRGILRAARSVALVVYAVVTATGALISPRLSLALGVPFAVIGGTLVTLLHKEAEDLPPLPHPLVAAIFLGSLPAAVAGTTTTFGVSPGIVIGLGLGLGAAAGLEWIATAPKVSPPGTATTADGVKDDRSLRQVLRALPPDQLFAEWRSTQTPDDVRGSELLIAVRIRELIIDELQRRDPAGTARWISEAPGEPPDGYVCVRR